MSHDVSSVIERRVTLRVLSYWERLRRGRPMPDETDINSEDMADLWPYCFMLHVIDLEEDEPMFSYLGSELKIGFDGGVLDQNAGKVVASARQVVAESKPVIVEDEYTNKHGETVKYRECLVPLGDESGVTAVFGGMRYKVFSQ